MSAYLFSSHTYRLADLNLLLAPGNYSEHDFLIMTVDMQESSLNPTNTSCLWRIQSNQISLAKTSQVIMPKVKGAEVYSSHECTGERETISEKKLIHQHTPNSINPYTPLWGAHGWCFVGWIQKGGNGPSLCLNHWRNSFSIPQCCYLVFSLQAAA